MAWGVVILPEVLPIKASDIEGPIDKSLGTKEALAVRLRKLAIDGEKTLQWVAFEHCIDRTARTWLSFIGAPESGRLP